MHNARRPLLLTESLKSEGLMCCKFGAACNKKLKLNVRMALVANLSATIEPSMVLQNWADRNGLCTIGPNALVADLLATSNVDVLRIRAAGNKQSQ
jgi:hypothetical protein